MSHLIVLGLLDVRAVSTLIPVWLIGIGALAGIVLISLFWSLLKLMGFVPRFDRVRRVADETWMTIREGVLFPVMILVCFLAVLGIIGTFTLQPVGKSLDILRSLPRLASVGVTEASGTLPGLPQPAEQDEFAVPPTPARQEILISFVGAELKKLEIEANENVVVAADPKVDVDSLRTIEVKAGVPFTWRKLPNLKSPAGDAPIDRFYFWNRGADAAQVNIAVTTDVVYPQVRMVLMVAAAVFGIFLLYLLQVTFAPRLSAIALATFKSEIAQPMFAIILIIGITALVVFVYVPYNTFGEDIKMLKDSGITLIRVLGIILAVWGASTTISDEIEGRTALTVLSKPVGRRSFVFGKFFGIGWTTALMFVVLGTVLMVVTSYKVVYDARESSLDMPTWQACYLQMSSVVPGLLLAFMETLILASLSVAISTRLPVFANFFLCSTVYVLGHLTPLIVQVTDARFEIVKFFGKLIATIFPNLEAFDLQTAMAGGLVVPGEYLLWALLYCFLFSLIAMLLALVLFEDRDMA